MQPLFCKCIFIGTHYSPTPYTTPHQNTAHQDNKNSLQYSTWRY